MSRFLKIFVRSKSSSSRTTSSRIKCTLIPGDGVFPELLAGVQNIFTAAKIPVDFEPIFLSELDPAKSASIKDVVKSISNNGVCLKGTLAVPSFSPTGDLQNISMKLGIALDLYAQVVHLKSFPSVKTRHENVDCYIIREKTEDAFSALEHEGVKGIVESLKIVTAKKARRIAKFAYDFATRHQRKKVTCVHKANIMKLGDGLFLKSCQDIGKLYPKIKFESMIVDNSTMQLVSLPQQFDVVVTSNLYGSLLNNIGTGLIGGAGMVPGVCYSPKCAVFEQAARHPYTEAVGKNVANPTAIIMSAVKLLRHVNLGLYADALSQAVTKVLQEGKVRTVDIGGNCGSQEFVQAIIENIKLPSKS